MLLRWLACMLVRTSIGLTLDSDSWADIMSDNEEESNQPSKKRIIGKTIVKSMR